MAGSAIPHCHWLAGATIKPMAELRPAQQSWIAPMHISCKAVFKVEVSEGK